MTTSQHSTINIAGLDRHELLKRLWNNTRPAAFYFLRGTPPPDFQPTDPRHTYGYIDYYCGRAIKTDIFSRDEIDPRLYDRDAGAGVFSRIVNDMRNEASNNS